MNSFREVIDIAKGQLIERIEELKKDEVIMETSSEGAVIVKLAQYIANGYVPFSRAYDEMSEAEKHWDMNFIAIQNTLKVIEGLEKLSEILD